MIAVLTAVTQHLNILMLEKNQDDMNRFLEEVRKTSDRNAKDIDKLYTKGMWADINEDEIAADPDWHQDKMWKWKYRRVNTSIWFDKYGFPHIEHRDPVPGQPPTVVEWITNKEQLDDFAGENR